MSKEQAETWEAQAETWAGFDVNEFQRQVIAEFRANNGKMSGMFEGWALAVLTTVGAKSGLRWERILGYLEFDDEGSSLRPRMAPTSTPRDTTTSARTRS